MRFIPARIAPLFMMLIVMPTMIMGLPFIVLIQRMPFESPQFWTVWGETVANVAPIAIPMALTVVVIARFIVGQFTIKPNLPN